MRWLSSAVVSQPHLGWIVRPLLIGAVVTILAVPSVCAQTSGRTNRGSAKGAGSVKQEAFLGLHLASVPDLLYAHVSCLTRGQGIVVEQVKSRSPADRAGLKRSDVLLSYNGTDIKDAEQFARLVREDKADHKAPLVLLRAGKEKTLNVALARAWKAVEKDKLKYSLGEAKKGPPPSVTVKAEMLGGGKMKVIFEYIPEGKSKAEYFKASGTLDDIAAKIKELPESVRDLAQVALDRLRNRKKS
jgi:hypothetical protein